MPSPLLDPTVQPGPHRNNHRPSAFHVIIQDACGHRNQMRHSQTFCEHHNHTTIKLPKISLLMACGARTLPGTVDAIAASTPHKIWARYPVDTSDFKAGVFKDVTFLDLARAINALAWRLHEAFPDRQPFDTVAYSGPPDIRYYALACAACKCGMKVQTSSWLCQARILLTIAVAGIVFITKEQPRRASIIT